MAFKPLQSNRELERGPWLPCTKFDDGQYDKQKAVFGRYMVDDPSGHTLELAAKNILRSIVILAPHRRDGSLQRSGIWDQWFGGVYVDGQFRNDVGLIYDDLTLALSQPSPPSHWYPKTLAARELLFGMWIKHFKKHTRITTAIIIVLSSIVSVIDIRFICLRGGAARRNGIGRT